ncbi:MAG: glycosyltransferase family 2 protein [Planctomycetes bacterium]|nr:glycosyltransferase family 2 protein [Planctomycetota bacterium]
MTLPRRLSALVVNYGTARFAAACVASLAREWLAAGGERGALELVVVDNASPNESERDLAALERVGARLVRSKENLGYARGANLALAHSAGERDDWIAVLNADLCFLPGSLEALFRSPASPRLGLLAPACYVDPACELALPPHRPPSVASTLAELAAEHSPDAARRLATQRARFAERVWAARDARLELPLLSGAALFAPRTTLARLGGLFDERYPLYYEDTDLARRVRAHDLACEFEPRARIVHHWARSSGVGAEFEADPRARFRVSQRAYFERWHGAFAARALAALDEASSRRAPVERCPPIHPLVELGPCATAPELVLPRAGRWVIELAMTPHFPLAAGVLVDGERWRASPRAWEWFFPGRYYLRALDRGSFECAGAWTFDKTSPARQDPLSLEETARDRGAL